MTSTRGRVDEAQESVTGALVLDNGRKLDKIVADQADTRVAMTSLAGDVKAILQRIERHDGDHAQATAEEAYVAADVERRLRALERRSYALPSLGGVLGVAGFLLALATALGSWPR